MLSGTNNSLGRIVNHQKLEIENLVKAEKMG
jgi:hypothetical protein